MTDILPGMSYEFKPSEISVGVPTGVSCANCRSELTMGSMHNCQFAGCPSCRGMLFRTSVFASFIQQLRSKTPQSAVPPTPMDHTQLNVQRTCPACQGKMETHAYGGPGNIVVDTCFPCELIFLDHGELTALAEAPGKR